MVAPLFGLYHMRDFAQDSVARNQLEFFGKYYGDQKVNIWKTSISYVGSGGNCADAPLSWKLDIDQQKCITDTWNEVLNGQQNALTCIDSYVAGGDPSAHCGRAAEGKD